MWSPSDASNSSIIKSTLKTKHTLILDPPKTHKPEAKFIIKLLFQCAEMDIFPQYLIENLIELRNSSKGSDLREQSSLREGDNIHQMKDERNG